MKKKTLITIICSALAAVLVASTVLIVAIAGKSGKKDAIWIMAEEMSGLFNPFYATAGADHDVVGMTQIGMLSTDYINGEPKTVAGDNYATVVKAFKYEYNEAKDETVYHFVIKNGLKFSDGKPLTMNDVMFNIYEYLDPIYTGSSTMYSTKIVGLADYRAQKRLNDGDVGESTSATTLARQRINELKDVYESDATEEDRDKNIFEVTPQRMYELIEEWSVSDTYKDAFEEGLSDKAYKDNLRKDYDLVCKLYREEVEDMYKASKDGYDFNTAPYKEHAAMIKDNDSFKFFLTTGDIKVEYGKDINGKEDKSKIVAFKGEEIASRYKTAEAAINYVVENKIKNSFNNIIAYGYSSTAARLLTRFEGDAKAVLLQQTGEKVEKIDGVVSMGHDASITDTKLTIEEDPSNPNLIVGGDQGEYTIAKQHKANGQPEKEGEYDVLQITIEKKDPKAIYNFGFTVAPWHYYSADENGVPAEMDIAANKFGVVRANSDFQNNVIQSQQHVSIPVGAGAYMATDKDNRDNPAITEFNKDNTVFFKANHNFMFEVKCEKIRFMVVSSSNAIDLLKKGDIDYITPQLTKNNIAALTDREAKNRGISVMSEWQLGYGYVGINAGLVPNIHVRRAIMAAMDAVEAKQYYTQDSVQTITWPMSRVSWAYPRDSKGDDKLDNGADYTRFTTVEAAEKRIVELMGYAADEGVTSNDLKITFTIAGASVTEHPTYQVFRKAETILNGIKEKYNTALEWDIEIKPDSYALTKLSTGSLAVWAAAWGSTIDPDMYQVYHKDSSASSTAAWGYRQIKDDATKYYREAEIINEKLSPLIEQGRETLNQEERKVIYEEAMKYVLELAVEMPIYQRKNLFAYNSKSVKGFREVNNPYSSPLDRIWELELA